MSKYDCSCCSCCNVLENSIGKCTFLPYDSIPLTDHDHEISNTDFTLKLNTNTSVLPPTYNTFDDEIININGMSIKIDNFGSYTNPITREEEIIKRFTWTTKFNMTLQVITYGARVTSLQIPDCENKVSDVLLGCDTIEDLIDNHEHYFGATIGQTVGIVNDSCYCNKGKTVHLSENSGSNHFNGGNIGFDQVNWTSYLNGSNLVLSHVTPENHEGYPGRVFVTIMFNIKNNNICEIKTSAIATQATPFNVGQRLYFNLAGHNAGSDALREHVICINSDTFLDENKLKPVDVGSTCYDLRVSDLLCKFMNSNENGYNTDYLVNLDENTEMTFAARLYHSESGRAMEIYSNQPVIVFNDCSHFAEFIPKPVREKEIALKHQTSKSSSVLLDAEDNVQTESKCINPNLYWPHCILRKQSEVHNIKSQFVPSQYSKDSIYQSINGGDDSSSYKENGIRGKENVFYYKNAGIYFQTQNYPPKLKSNRKFRDEVLLAPGQIFEQKVVYKFGLFLKSINCDE